MNRIRFAIAYISALWEYRDHASAIYVARLARRRRLNKTRYF